MNGWLVDTNVISALRNATSTDPIAKWFSRASNGKLYLSAVCLMELRYGAELAGGEKGRALSQWIDTFVLGWFAGAILPVDDAVLLTWRRLLHRLRTAGRTIGEPDSLIAATALENRLGIVSRDVRAFAACEVPVFDPWSYEFTPPGGAAIKLKTGSVAEALRAGGRNR